MASYITEGMIERERETELASEQQDGVLLAYLDWIQDANEEPDCTCDEWPLYA